MITRILAVLFSAAVTSAAWMSTVSGAPGSHPLMMRVDQIERQGIAVVHIGTPEAAVWDRLGRPEQWLSDNVWVYRNYHSDQPAAMDHACRTLLIRFEGHRVAGISLLNEQAHRVVAKRLRVDPGYLARTLVAKK